MHTLLLFHLLFFSLSLTLCYRLGKYLEDLLEVLFFLFYLESLDGTLFRTSS